MSLSQSQGTIHQTPSLAGHRIGWNTCGTRYVVVSSYGVQRRRPKREERQPLKSRNRSQHQDRQIERES